LLVKTIRQYVKTLIKGFNF